MIIFLYGRDSYRLKQNIEKISAEYAKKHPSGVNFSVLDFNEPGQLAKLSELIKTVSFFNETRLIIIKNSFSDGKEIAGLIKKWGLETDKQRILVFAENCGKADLTKKDNKLFAVLAAKPNMVQNFEPLNAKQLESWAGKEIKYAGCDIRSPALKKLINCVSDVPLKNAETDAADIIWRLKQEIDKLTSYKSIGGDKEINAADIELLVIPTVNLNIFEMTDAIASKHRFGALRLLSDHLDSGADPHYIFSMLVYQFRNLLRIKSLAQDAVSYSDIIKKTRLHPFVVKKMYEQCKRFDLDELKHLFSQLAKIDIGAKSGEIDMADSLYQFTFSLAA